MNKKFFLFFFISVFLISLVYAAPEDCTSNQCYVADADSCINMGQVYMNEKYCDFSGNLVNQKAIDTSCTNDYECLNSFCIEGKCNVKYELQDKSFLDTILAWFSGGRSISCSPAGNESCDGTNYLVCNSSLVWENKGDIDGKCGYNIQRSRGGGCSPRWVCGNWTNIAQQCGSRICTDLKGCGKTYNKPLEVYTCPLPGQSSEQRAPFCGDAICNGAEDCWTCSFDCGECDYECRTAVDCDADYDCTEGKCVKKSSWIITFLLWLVFLIVLAALIFVAYLLYKKFREGKNEEQFVIGKDNGADFPESGVSEPVAVKTNSLEPEMFQETSIKESLEESSPNNRNFRNLDKDMNN